MIKAVNNFGLLSYLFEKCFCLCVECVTIELNCMYIFVKSNEKARRLMLWNDVSYRLVANCIIYCIYIFQGKGYPEGKKETEIPLCARIMAIADVFDAVSQKRCYREAMPLEQCFDIIKKGSGQDFEPLLVEIFMDIRDKVEAIYHEIYEEA